MEVGLGAEMLLLLSTGGESHQGTVRQGAGRTVLVVVQVDTAHHTSGLVEDEQVVLVLSWSGLAGRQPFPVVGCLQPCPIIWKGLLRPRFCFFLWGGFSCLGLWKEPFIT